MKTLGFRLISMKKAYSCPTKVSGYYFVARLYANQILIYRLFTWLAIIKNLEGKKQLISIFFLFIIHEI